MIPPAPTWELEQALWEAGFRAVVGLDEAGRGALAGPLVAAAVVFGPEAVEAAPLSQVRDSKRLSPQARAALVHHILAQALGWAIGWVSWEEVDRWGPSRAARVAFLRALRHLPLSPDFVLTDYELLPLEELPQAALVRGDSRSITVAAASILAKTVRDAYMQGLHWRYPVYHFARHKGYGTALHRAVLTRTGPAPVHRQRFLRGIPVPLPPQEEP